MKALCIRADSELFRLGKVYDVFRIDDYTGAVHVATGNYFGDVLVCARLSNGRCGARVFTEENIYVFELCERRMKNEG